MQEDNKCMVTSAEPKSAPIWLQTAEALAGRSKKTAVMEAQMLKPHSYESALDLSCKDPSFDCPERSQGLVRPGRSELPLPHRLHLWCALRAMTYLWLVGNGGMGYEYNYYYYHSSIPY